MTGSAVRYGSAGTMAYEQWQKIKIREEEAIGKLTKKKKKKGKQRWRERKMNGMRTVNQRKEDYFKALYSRKAGADREGRTGDMYFSKGGCKREASEY